MIQPPFPSTIGAQPRQITFLTTKTAVRKKQDNNSQMGSHAWTSQCLRRGGGGLWDSGGTVLDFGKRGRKGYIGNIGKKFYCLRQRTSKRG